MPGKSSAYRAFFAECKKKGARDRLLYPQLKDFNRYGHEDLRAAWREGRKWAEAALVAYARVLDQEIVDSTKKQVALFLEKV